MEDKGRGMGANRKIMAPIGKRKDAGKDAMLTIMIMGPSGGMHSFKVSKCIIICTLLFFLLYIPGSVLLINQYFNLTRRFADQTETIENLQVELADKKIGFRQKAQHEENLIDLENFRQGLLDFDEDILPVEEEHSILDDEISINVVKPFMTDISDLIIDRGEDSVSIKFKLLNKRNDGNPVEGYIHIIGFGKAPDPPADWNYFNNNFSNELPVDYRRGLGFLIQRFKPYERMFRQISGGELPYEIRVVVYDKSGNLIYVNNFEVPDES